MLSTKTALVTATVSFSIILCFFLIEIAIRVFLPFNTPDTIRHHSLEYTPTVFARTLLEPVDRLVDLDGAKAWGTKLADAPSEQSIYISANGYRGDSFPPRKATGTTRIIVIGGSAVFDQYVSDSISSYNNSWPNLVQEQLRAKGYENIEVINAGIPGHSSADSLGRFISQLWMYEPDYLVIYHGWNDIKFWNSLAIDPDQPLITRVRPYERDANLFMYYNGFWDQTFAKSQLYVKLRNRYLRSKNHVGTEGIVPAGTEYAEHYLQYGPEQFRLNVELMVNACKLLDITPILVTQATLVVRDLPPGDRTRVRYDYQQLTHEGLVRAFEQTYDIIQSIGIRTNTEIIDVASEMNGRSNLFVDHVHTTPAGSKALARLVSDALASRIAVSSADDVQLEISSN